MVAGKLWLSMEDKERLFKTIGVTGGRGKNKTRPKGLLMEKTEKGGVAATRGQVRHGMAKKAGDSFGKI